MIHRSPPSGKVIAELVQGVVASADSAGRGRGTSLAASTFIDAATHLVKDRYRKRL
jgi:hypothetical protein